MARRADEAVPSEEHGELQRLVDDLFSSSRRVDRIDVLIQADARDFSDDLREVVERLPPGGYSRAKLADQLNSTLAAHGWGRRFGTVD